MEIARPAATAKSSRWHSASTWLALAIVLLCFVFTFEYPLILIAIIAGSMDDVVFDVAPMYGLVFWSVPVIGLLVWIVAMLVRWLGRKQSGLWLWTAFKYGIIAFGGTGLAVMVMMVASRNVDIASIRDWSRAYQPPSDAEATLSGNGVFVPAEQWPEAIRRLNPEMVQYTLGDKCVHIIFGGGFGHWGLTVGPKGTTPYGDRTRSLEDGAWVWEEIQ